MFILRFIFFVSVTSSFSEKHFLVRNLSSDIDLFLFLSVVTSLISFWFLTFCKVLSNAILFINSKKSLLKTLFVFFLNPMFLSLKDFSHALDWIRLPYALFMMPFHNPRPVLMFLCPQHDLSRDTYHRQVSGICQSSLFQAGMGDYYISSIDG